MPDLEWTYRGDGTTTWGTREPHTSTSTISTWTVATRPAAPSAGQTGFNTDFKGVETYTGTKWMIENGTWTTATRPVTTNIAPGSKGFNSDTGLGDENWNGIEWVSF